jgi:hypothetical protein
MNYSSYLANSGERYADSAILSYMIQKSLCDVFAVGISVRSRGISRNNSFWRPTRVCLMAHNGADRGKVE